MCILSELTFPFEKSLTLPPLPNSFLKCTVDPKSNSLDESTFVPTNLPFESGPVIHALVSSAKLLSFGDDVKTTLEIMFNTEGTSLTYLPGDTIGILPENPEEDIEFLLERLGLDQSNCKYKIEIVEGTSKKKPILPSHLPPVASARFFFQKCLDLRAVVKKVFLRALVDYTTNELEKRRLKELCSREGTGEYNAQILSKKSSIIDILKVFPSCSPSLSLLIEYLPRLQPRPYSIASSPLQNPDKLRIVFNVAYDSRNRRGICSGWLFDITRPFHDITYRLTKLNLDENDPSIKVPLYLRKSTKFKIPEDPTIPLIMIGPGTGVAPFVGFLEHRRMQSLNSDDQKNPKNILLFGCRYPKKDEIFRDVLQMFQDLGICEYLPCYSRAEQNDGDAKYVQDIIKHKKYDIVKQLLSTHACIFICGNGNTMGNDVIETLVSCFIAVEEVSQDEARNIINTFEQNGRILKDLWL